MTHERVPFTARSLTHSPALQVGVHLSPQDLPEAHVCFNQLVLPPAASQAALKDKLMLAVREGREGFELY